MSVRLWLIKWNICYTSTVCEIYTNLYVSWQVCRYITHMYANVKLFSGAWYYHLDYTVYANVYCFLCNNPTFTICSTTSIVKRLPLSMLYLLDINVLTQVPVLDKREASGCADDEVFDNIFVSYYLYIYISIFAHSQLSCATRLG